MTILLVAAGGVARAQGHAAARIDLFGGIGSPSVSGDASDWLRRGSGRAAASLTRSSGYAFGDLRIGSAAAGARPTTWTFDAGMTDRSSGTWRFGWTASAGATDDADGRPAWNARSIVTARLGRSGVWAGAGPGSDGGGGAVGAWTLFGNALFTATVESNRVSTLRNVVRDVTVRGRDSVYTDTSGWVVYPTSRTRSDTASTRLTQTLPTMTMRADWAVGRWAVSAGATRFVQAGSSAITTATATVATRIANGVGLVADVGSSSRRLAGQPARYVSLGVRLWSPTFIRPAPAPVRPVARAFSLTPTAVGRYRLALRAPFARTVEVTGDFNGWSSTPLNESSPGLWELTLALTPGVHAINVRLNGEAWTVPPGVRTAEDEFNGHVGIIVVP